MTTLNFTYFVLLLNILTKIYTKELKLTGYQMSKKTEIILILFVFAVLSCTVGGSCKLLIIKIP